MHDGQNIFTGEASYSGMGWEIHHTADELIQKQAMEEIIIVGIANDNARRLSEYAHFDGSFQGKRVKAMGEKYENFLLKDVMPFIEANFRVLTGVAHTALMGSSMGGLVTFTIGLRHPDTFGMLGVVSPSFWWNPEALLAFVDTLNLQDYRGKMWLDIGTAEGEMTQGFEKMIYTLKEKGDFSDMVWWIVPDGKHSEYDWQLRAHCPLLYFFGNIGNPEHLEIFAPDVLEQGDHTAHLHSTLVYDSGFCMTPEDVEYGTSSEEILSIGWDETLYANSPGEVVLTGIGDGLPASRHCTVTESSHAESV
jgi:hypothetical protein